MPRSFPCLLAPFVLFLSLAAGGDDRAPQRQEKSPEIILSEQGLKLVGWSYVLKDTLDTFERDQQMRANYQPLVEQRARLNAFVRQAEIESNTRHLKFVRNGIPGSAEDTGEKQVDDPKKDAEAKEAYTKAMQLWTSFQDTYGRELGRYESRVAETEAIYRKLSADPEVKQAIRSHNLHHRPRVVLGPVAGREDYLAALHRDDLSLLQEKGVAFDPKRKQLVLTIDDQVRSLAFQAERQLDALEAAEKRATGVTSQRDDLVAKLKAAETEFAKAPHHLTPQKKATIELFRSQIKRLPADNGDRAAAAELVATRKAFLMAVEALRDATKTAPASADRWRATPRSVTSFRILSERGVRRRIAGPLEWDKGCAILAKLEKTIRTDHVPLVRGSGGQMAIAVTLNGSYPVSMAIDTKAAMTLLPAALAQRVGATPVPGELEVDTLLPAPSRTETVAARRSRLRLVQIGTFSIEGASCLVLSADAPAEMGPVLGSGVLDNFAWELPAGGAELTLTQVIPALARETKPKGVRP